MSKELTLGNFGIHDNFGIDHLFVGSKLNYSKSCMNNIKTKIQIFHDDHSAFGPGKADLLVAISTHGSISAAARSIGMSYKRAWELVDGMNKGFKEELVVKRIGGSHGGGAVVTEFGLKTLALYREAIKNSDSYIEKQMSELISNLKP